MKKLQTIHPVTMVVNQKQKAFSQNKRHQALAWLAEKFPLAFDNTKRIRPLKIGIMHDILQLSEQAAKDNISRSKLREAVVLFTRRVDYLSCLKAQESRIDLLGNTVAPVTEEEAEKAAIQIKKLVEKRTRDAQNLTEKQAPGRSFGINLQSPKPLLKQAPSEISARSQVTTHNWNTLLVQEDSSKSGTPQSSAEVTFQERATTRESTTEAQSTRPVPTIKRAEIIIKPKKRSWIRSESNT